MKLGTINRASMLILSKAAGVFSKPSKRKIYEYLRSSNFHPGKAFLHKVVLGIETSCDDTAAAVVDEAGNVLGEAIHSQTEVHLKTGGIVPPVAQQLHRENIQRIVQEALSASRVPPSELSAVATTTMPGLALSLGVGLSFSLQLVGRLKKPFIPIHHMEAHALTIRLTNEVEFPFLVLLISGGHCLLALVRGVADFLLLGKSLDIAPGDMLDKWKSNSGWGGSAGCCQLGCQKGRPGRLPDQLSAVFVKAEHVLFVQVARRLSLTKHPECTAMSGGKAIEHLAKQGNRLRFDLTPPMHRAKNCDFSFTGLQHAVNKIITQKEKEEGVEQGQVLASAADIAAAVQHTTACHLAKRTHRALLFCQQRGLLPPSNAALVVSGGVASNFYIRKALELVTNATQCALLCPPPRLCTDNGVMIAWNGIERLRAGVGILYDTEGVRYEPKCPLGVDISKEVGEAAIKVPQLKMKI
ncbi:tRNA N6-adenosine threonylcarbamoyltransferase, mitochondrial isoform X2 [Myotis daubentonii]|uniref:tRNA N6-adenosine threonylcarbamoyltransferase, mitochondrial isoform X2 n=1 Tax=Myotis daubentonii TaxID=98922 RepID=UPI002873BB6A|nr:tRNA N6-adenosine threonylcarbamoyltransferase, mitochondrial isoform X2 [Myotis daubentonii]